MFDLEDLYQEIIMDHNRRPRNFTKLSDANRNADGFNPLCGDQISLYLNVTDNVIVEIGFQASGCAISKASASMMTEEVKGKTEKEAKILFTTFRQMITKESTDHFDSELLGDLEILRGISEYPARIKCATLSWHTLNAAIIGKNESISTE